MNNRQNRVKKGCRAAAWLSISLPALLIFLSFPQSLIAQTTVLSPSIDHQAAPPPLTSENVETWLDGLLPYALKEGDIAGCVVSIVKDGHVLFEKGYGYADVSSKRPMDPVQTIIRPGSISKLFIWTAVMQLSEEGKLDLDADINRYLDFNIPPYHGQPITLHNIMTHRTGFEDVLKDIMGRYPPASLEHYIKAHLPKRIYAPGKIPAYSNYGSALASYIVERVSGEKFADYAAKHIFQPLGMTSSTFQQPVDPARQSYVSLGYSKASKAPGYYEFVGPFPAGGLNTTAADMAKFMIAHLQNGQLGNNRILSEKTAIAMHAPEPKIFPALDAMADGFYEASRNGHRIIAHNGGTQFFSSDLHLMLDDGVGIFISLNSMGNDHAAPKVYEALFKGFVDRYFPQEAKRAWPLTDPVMARKHAHEIAGLWGLSIRSETSWFSLSSLYDVVTLNDNGDGTVSMTSLSPDRRLINWRETRPYLWVSGDGKEKMQAVSKDGKPVMIGFDIAPPAALLPIPWWRSPAWIIPSMWGIAGMLLLLGLSWPADAAIRRIYHLPKGPLMRTLRYRAACLISLGLVAIMVAYPVLLDYLSSDLTNMSGKTDGLIYTLQAAALAILTASVIFTIATVRYIYQLKLGWSRLVFFLALLVANGVLWWIAVVFHLINFNTHY